MEKPVVLLFCILCVASVLLAGCAGSGAKSADPAVGTYGDPARSAAEPVTFTLNGDGTFAWKFPLYTVNGRWERVDDTTISLDGKVESSAGAISVPKTVTFDPVQKTLQIGSTTYKLGATGAKSHMVAFTAQNAGDSSAIHDVNVVFQGGSSAADLTGYVISVDGTAATEVTDTTIGKETVVTSLSPGKHYIMVTAKFNDGTEAKMFGSSV